MIKAPMVLGYEVTGRVIHSNSSELYGGQTVVINPSKPCGHCKYCIEHSESQCTDICFFGSAMCFPHIGGGPTRYKTVETSQCIPYPAKTDEKVMVSVEPLVVAIHTVHQVGEPQGKRVSIPGVGSVGCLIVSVVKTLGAVEIVRVDVSPRSLSLGKEMRAGVFANPQNDDMDHWKTEEGYFDVGFEVSGHPSSVSTCLEVIRARGVMAQVGMGGATAEFPMMTLVGKETLFGGPFRFTSGFNTAVSWLVNGVINPLPLLGAGYPFADLEEALRFAGDRTQAARVQLAF